MGRLPAWLAVTAAALLGGCAFDSRVSTESGLPHIACADVAECPPAFVCTLGACLPEDLPVAVDAALATEEDTATSVQLLGDRAGLVFAVVEPPRGTLSVDPAGLGTYAPPAGESGADSFRFVASDGVLTSLPATLIITIAPVNDPPSVTGAAVETEEDTPVGVDLGLFDVELDPLTVALAQAPTQGSVTLAGGVAFYDPARDFFGADTFVVRASDGLETADATVSPRSPR